MTEQTLDQTAGTELTGTELTGTEGTGVELTSTEGTTVELADTELTGEVVTGEVLTGAVVDVAVDAAIAGTAAAPVTATPSKMAICRQLMIDMCAKKATRQDILAAFQTTGGTTEAGANTYYATLKRDLKISGERTERAPKPAADKPATTAKTTTKPGASTQITGAKSGKASTAGAVAPFSVVIADEHGMVASTNGYFSQLLAANARDKMITDKQRAHLIIGAAEIGKPISMYQSPEIA